MILIRETPPVNDWRRFICAESPLRRKALTRSGQCRQFGARSLSTNPTEEKINGQGSTKKQPREEETETGEGKTCGRRIAVFCHAAEACDLFFFRQKTIAPAKLDFASVIPSYDGIICAWRACPSRWNHFAEKEPRQINMLEQILIGEVMQLRRDLL
jgi:hypothetical protein